MIIQILFIWLGGWLCSGQTAINLGKQGKGPDFGSMAHTRPVQTGVSLPSTCSVGELFFHSASSGGQNLHGCVSENTWEKLSGLGGCSVDSGGVLTCPVRVETGGGGEAGELLLLEKAVEGGDYISLLAPNSLNTTYRLRMPPSAPVNQVLLFSAMVNGVADGTWVERYTKAPERQYFPTVQRLGAAGWGISAGWSVPETVGPAVSGGGTSPFQAGYLIFPAGEKRDVLLQARMPQGWDQQAVTAKLIWSAPNGGTGTNVKWQASVGCVDDGQDLMMPSFSPAMEIVVPIPYPGDIAVKRITSQFSPAVWTGCTVNSIVNILISRDGTGDSNASAVYLFGAELDFMKGLQ